MKCKETQRTDKEGSLWEVKLERWPKKETIEPLIIRLSYLVGNRETLKVSE